MAKKTKAKKAKPMSFRQRLRVQSADRLDIMEEAVRIAVRDVVAPHSAVNPHDIMRLLCTGQTKTLREQIITELANETEFELEALYNKQLNLLPEGSDGDEKES